MMSYGISSICQSKAHLINLSVLLQQYISTFFRFKWTHLSERLAYEKAVHHQRLRTEISQAKREADFFKANVEKSKRLARKRKNNQEPSPESPNNPKRVYDFRQKETDSSIRSKRNQNK